MAAGTGRGTRPQSGQWSAAVSTRSAAHPEQVNMPAGDEKGISSAHHMSIT